MLNKLYARKLKIAVLAVLPVVFAIIAISLHFLSGKSFMQRVDPEYLHLFNGLNIAIGNLAVEYVFHPGTSIQIIYAISAHIVDIFMPGGSIISKALDNPEQFVHAANILMNLLTAISLFCLGYFSYKHSGNFILAVILQLLPFGNYRIILMSSRIIPEAVMLAPFMILIILIIRYIYDNRRDEHPNLYVIGFAIAGALGMAGKLSYFPFLLPPLFLFPNNNLRFKYLAYTIVATMVFAFPLLVNFGKSWDWYFGMFMHSGRWGEGSSNIVNMDSFPGNILRILKVDVPLSVIAGIALVEVVVCYILGFIRKVKFNNLMLRLLLAFLIVFALSVLMVAKHFAYHYFTPTLMLKIFFIFMMSHLMILMVGQKKIRVFLWVLVLMLSVGMVMPQLAPLRGSARKIIDNTAKYDEDYELLKPYFHNAATLVISSHYRGSPFIQSAFVDGFLISGFLKSTFKEELNKRYPNTYFSLNWTEDFYYWDKFLKAEDFVKTGKPILIYIGEDKEKDLDRIVERIKTAFPEYNTELKLLIKLEFPSEQLYQLSLKRALVPNPKE
ncbi:MAG: hypothetical protein GXO88_15330 [Chlorobi bacterium]|nr:hypothetical protein [Chlorobiota bacterium]